MVALLLMVEAALWQSKRRYIFHSLVRALINSFFEPLWSAIDALVRFSSLRTINRIKSICGSGFIFGPSGCYPAALLRSNRRQRSFSLVRISSKKSATRSAPWQWMCFAFFSLVKTPSYWERIDEHTYNLSAMQKRQFAPRLVCLLSVPHRLC